MSALLTTSLEIVTVSFALIMALDFINGLVHLYVSTSSTSLVKSQSPKIESEMVGLSTQVEHFEQIVYGRNQIESVDFKIATLLWIEQNMPPVEMWVAEMPDAIKLCKSRQPKVEPVSIQLATRQQLVSAGIRKCKKLASSLHVQRYSTMKLAQLADILEGKVTVAELVA